jgi:type IV pilus assembly protein PilW
MKLLRATHHSNPRVPSRIQFAGGFSLIEVMVAMVIGMVGIIVMMQMFSLTEGQKRTTTGAADAQSAGAIALYGLQRDIRQSGYGIVDTNLLGCNILLRAGVTLNAIGPVTINHASIPAGDPNTDTLLVVYGNSNSSPQGETITDLTSAVTPPYTVAALTSFTTNDRVIAAPATRLSPCALTLDTVTGVTTRVAVTTGSAGMGLGTLFNLGQSPKIQAYAVHRGNLTVCDYMTSNCGTACSALDGPASTALGGSCSAAWVPIASNVVSLRAEYGRDITVPMDTIVDAYDQSAPTIDVSSATAATAKCEWSKISALRLALVLRSGQYEKTAVTAGVVWAGTTSATPVLINLTSTDANWQNYRYKVYQTTVPLRNVSWLGAQTGC